MLVDYQQQNNVQSMDPLNNGNSMKTLQKKDRSTMDINNKAMNINSGNITDEESQKQP